MQDNHKYNKLDRLWRRGKEFLGTEYAIMGGAMSWVSESNLVSAISNGGGFGVIACGAMEPHMLRKQIKSTQEKTDKPFGVNLIVMHPDLEELMDICIDTGVTHVVLAGGLARAAHIVKLKECGIKIIGFAPNLPIGSRMVKSGMDALVIEGMEAGGHIGPVSTSVLAQEVLPSIKEVPVFVAGGIGHGDMMLGYLLMGASGCQLGTAFVCASESIAHPEFKKAFIRAGSRDAVASVQLSPDFPVIPVRALSNESTKEFMQFQHQTINQYHAHEIAKEEAKLRIEKYWAGALRKAVIEGDVVRGSVMAGQSVGMVKKEQPAIDIMQELIEQALNAIVDGVTAQF